MGREMMKMATPYKDLDWSKVEALRSAIDGLNAERKRLILRFEEETGVKFIYLDLAEQGRLFTCNKCGDKAMFHVPLCDGYGYVVSGYYRCDNCGYEGSP
jgi:predicted RNA-binding Zn-ribbon protein involved in translation (DUF1610 family)